MIAPTILQLFGVSVLPADVQSIADPAQQLLGASLAAYGRIKAQGPLTLRF